MQHYTTIIKARKAKRNALSKFFEAKIQSMPVLMLSEAVLMLFHRLINQRICPLQMKDIAKRFELVKGEGHRKIA